ESKEFWLPEKTKSNRRQWRKQRNSRSSLCLLCYLLFSFFLLISGLVMPTSREIDVRPRTTGEIMDDAWRLYLADLPTLLLLSGLFYVPLATLGLALVTRRPSEGFMTKLWLPVLTGLAVPWTGIGAGACQEAFRRRPQGDTLVDCLRAA